MIIVTAYFEAPDWEHLPDVISGFAAALEGINVTIGDAAQARRLVGIDAHRRPNQ